MADKELHELTSGTPTLTDITVFGGPSGGAEIKKTTWQSLKDLFKTSYDSVYQAILVSGTNIKTFNGQSVLGSGDVVIPTFSDGDKGDFTVSSGIATIDNNVISNAKLSTVATNTIKGRTTVGTGNVEDLTPTQVAGMLPVATTSTAGTMSASDKTKVDAINDWTLLTTMAISLGSSQSSGTLTSYNYYQIIYDLNSTDSSTYVGMRINNDSTSTAYQTTYLTSSTVATSSAIDAFNLCTPNSSWGAFGQVLVKAKGGLKHVSGNGLGLAFGLLAGVHNYSSDATSFQFYRWSGTGTIGGTIKIYGKN